jgi:hypothetical protein
MRGDAPEIEGIPTSGKDEDAGAGWPLTAGSVLMKDNRATDPDGRYAVGGGRLLHAQTAPIWPITICKIE